MFGFLLLTARLLELAIGSLSTYNTLYPLYSTTASSHEHTNTRIARLASFTRFVCCSLSFLRYS